MTDNANNRPTIRQSFWLGMFAFSILLIAICLPLYVATSSFFADRYARQREYEEVYEEAESIAWDHPDASWKWPASPPPIPVDDDSD
jgi:hypothetical protein